MSLDGTVRITDRRAGGRSYLVDEGFSSMAELEALVADYLEMAPGSTTPRWPGADEKCQAPELRTLAF